MNFVLHHHLAARDLGRPEAAAGAMLPDVWRIADRRARVRGDRSDAAGARGDWVVAGIAHHLATDAWFHRSPLFSRGEQAARDVLRRARSAPKICLFAHIAWELCLDGALVRRLGAEPILRGMRASAAAVRPELHHRAAERRVALPAHDRAGFPRRVDRVLDAIAAGPWVASYATAWGVLGSVQRVRARLGFAPMDRADADAVAAGIEELGRQADASLEAIANQAPNPAGSSDAT